jgi:hypothetical protein
VLRLKQHISETHVNKPNIKDQRLIYAGNLLKDSQTLKQVFFRDSLCTELTNSNKTDFTIHLVCSNSSQKSTQATASNLGPANSNSAPATQTSPTSSTRINSTSATVTPPPPPSSSSVNTNNIQRDSNPNNQSSQAPSSPNMTSAQVSGMVNDLLQSEQMRQQLVTLQQLANLVATELAQNLAINFSIYANQNSPGNSAQTPMQLSNISELLNSGQPINISTINTTAQAANTASQTDNGQVDGNDITAQLIYAGQPNRNGHNLTGDTNVNDPRVAHQPEANQFGLNHAPQAQAQAVVAGPQQQQRQVQAPQAPIIEQPVPAQPVDAEQILQHDVIDWVYYSIRAMVLMAALYIHASLFRLLFIFGLLAIAFFLNRRSARRQNQPEVRQNAAQPPQPMPAENRGAPANDAPLEEAGELRRRRVNGNEPVADGDRNQIVDNAGDPAHFEENAGGEDIAQRRVSFFKLCYLVVADFLASLVPE